MKRAVIFNLLFFIFLYTFGQKKIIHKEISWEPPKSISHYYTPEQKDYNKTDFLSFEGAQYLNQENMLPYFYEIIPVTSKNIDVRIINLKTVSSSTQENNILSKYKEIAGIVDLKFNTSLMRGKPYVQIRLLPLIKNSYTGQIEKVISFDIEIITKEETLTSVIGKEKTFANESVLKSGYWIKIQVTETGIYQIPYNQIIDLGFDNPSNIRIFGNSEGMLPVNNTEEFQDDLNQLAIYFEKGADGIFNEGDYILFYAKSPNKWVYDANKDFYSLSKHLYSDYNYYFITTDAGTSKTIQKIAPPTETATILKTNFTDYFHHENDVKNVLESGQLWLGEYFDATTSYSFNFDIPNRETTSPVKSKIELAARSPANSTFTLRANGISFANPEIAYVNMSSYTSTYAYSAVSENTFNSNTENITIQIAYNKATSSSVGWLDYITLNVVRKLQMDNGQLIFRYYNPTTNNQIVEFVVENTNATTRFWDITHASDIEELEPTTTNGKSKRLKVYAAPGLNEYIAFNNTGFLISNQSEPVANQNLHSINHRDMIIITHPDFLSQAEKIATIHQEHDNLNSTIVTIQQIYNEFSSGTPDASAIRNFIKMIYKRPSATDTLKYVLFIGDGSFDHKSISANNINYVPTYQSKSSLNPISSFVTDDFFGLLDSTDNVEASNSGLVDIGIGRLPVKSLSEAEDMVSKIETYLNPNNKGDWINTICFVGDDEDNNLHMEDADKLAKFVDTTYPYFFIQKIYLDAFPQQSSSISESYPEVSRIINDKINNGVLIFNYTGHGGENGLAHEKVVTMDMINSWANSNKLAIFMTATCEFSRFDNHKYISAGEQVLLNPNGGAIALFSTTRLVYSSPNYTLNRNFYNYVFEKDHKGNNRALGDIIRLAKNASGTENNKRNFALLGDPALKIPNPEYKVITDSVNHISSEVTDTLNALSKVTIHGHIVNNYNEKLSSYNGLIYPLVLDKKKEITSLANDGGAPMVFDVQNNILYKGKVSVTNGEFNFSFVVPKDISYNFDKGKISYYSTNSTSDAKGYFDNFIIGGSNNNAALDNTGPVINLYMNNENFVSGGVTDENPVLFAVLSDSSGINTVGNGIGHDITAVIDNNTSQIIMLNDYYKADVDDYQNGRIEYLFSGLDEGEHQLKVKVWDVYNNSSEKQIDFIVAQSENLSIKNIFNYPNPFTDQTVFYFDHNRPNEDLEVLIQVFTVSGKIVKSIRHIINNNSFRSDPIPWDGLDDFGDKIGRGVYLYVLKVKTSDGQIAQKIEKIVVLK